MNHIQQELIGFYRMLVTGYHHKQLQEYEYHGKIERAERLHYYNKDKTHKKLALFLNGGTQFNTGHNIEKIISCLLKENIDYDVACYINPKTYNLLCINDICKSIRNLGYDEIDIVGLSIGTLIGSHVVRRLVRKGTSIKLKLICIDPIMNMYESALRTFDHNFIHRPDLLQHYPEGFFNAIKKFNCGYSELFNLTNIDNYVAFLHRHYDLSPTKYKRLVRFQIPNCHVHFIHTIKDPVVIHEENRYQYQQLQKNKKCKIKHYYIKDQISHCTLIQSHPEIQMEFLNKCINA